MTCDLTQRATALIEHIQTRFHDGHRRALPQLMTMAAAVEAQGIAKGLVDALRAIGHALEQHMFKEEMRLFPMMEQGGNMLIGLLIDDLHLEHVAHQQAINALRAHLGMLAKAHNANLELLQFTQGLDDLSAELALHIRAEDEELFQLFARPAFAGFPSTANPPSNATSTS